MKLKRLLSGVTAAIMALSSVAITSFTSVSASELADNAPYQWTGKWQKQKPDIFTTTSSKGGILAEDWGTSYQLCVSEFDISDMKNPTFEVEFEGSDTFQVATTDEAGKAFNEIGNGTSGQSVLIPEKYRSESRFLLSTGGNTGILTKVSIYDDPNPPAQPEAFTSITYNFTVTEGGNTTVTFADPDSSASFPSEGKQVTTSGDYTIDRKFSSPRISLPGLGMILAKPSAVKVKVNSIKVNDQYTFDVGGLEIDSADNENNALPHIYRADGQAAVVYKTDGAYIAGGANIKLMIGEPPEVVEKPKPTAPPYSGKTYKPQLSYFDGNKSFDARGNDKTYGGPIAEIGGTYTLGIDANDFKNWPEQTASGITCLYIDMLGMATAFGANTEKGVNSDFDTARALAISKGLSVTNLSIILDGKEFYKYKDSDIYFGDFEGNGNLRIDLVNTYSEVKYPAALDAIKLYFSVVDSLEIRFTLKTPLTPKATASPGTNTKKPTPTTANPEKAAKAKVKNAKIKNLSVKSKAKKKISVSWKKVNKVNGYQVQVANKKNFKGKSIVLKKFTTKTKLTVKSPKIKSKKSYFVRVRAYATYKTKNKTVKVYGKFSAKKKVKVK